mmetsp:Transcript_5326/g.19985  ORF Transcript_5326/g.19985 Transcript_5326/m.19985 type:complete len:476 (-) Transcript_5326:297-1724(-)
MVTYHNRTVLSMEDDNNQSVCDQHRSRMSPRCPRYSRLGFSLKIASPLMRIGGFCPTGFLCAPSLDSLVGDEVGGVSSSPPSPGTSPSSKSSSQTLTTRSCPAVARYRPSLLNFIVQTASSCARNVCTRRISVNSLYIFRFTTTFSTLLSLPAGLDPTPRPGFGYALAPFPSAPPLPALPLGDRGASSLESPPPSAAAANPSLAYLLAAANRFLTHRRGFRPKGLGCFLSSAPFVSAARAAFDGDAASLCASSVAPPPFAFRSRLAISRINGDSPRVSSNSFTGTSFPDCRSRTTVLWVLFGMFLSFLWLRRPPIITSAAASSTKYSRPVSRSFKRNAVLGISGDTVLGVSSSSSVGTGVLGVPVWDFPFGDGDPARGVWVWVCGPSLIGVANSGSSFSPSPTSNSTEGIVSIKELTSSEPCVAIPGEARGSAPLVSVAVASPDLVCPVGCCVCKLRVSHDTPGASEWHSTSSAS